MMRSSRALEVGHKAATSKEKSMRKITFTLALALAFVASAALTADAQTSRGANNIAGAAQNFTPVEPGGVPGMGALLPAGIRPYLRPLALLVPPLLVIDKREAAATAASFPISSPVMIPHHLA
jgi:hypothetical protein